MRSRSTEYKTLVQQFSAKLGSGVVRDIDMLVDDVEQGLVKAARTSYDADRVCGINSAVNRIITVLPMLITRCRFIGQGYWTVQNLGNALNLGVTQVPCDISFGSTMSGISAVAIDLDSGDGLGDLLLDTYWGAIKQRVIQTPSCRLNLVEHFPATAHHADDPELHKKLYLEMDI